MHKHLTVTKYQSPQLYFAVWFTHCLHLVLRHLQTGLLTFIPHVSISSDLFISGRRDRLAWLLNKLAFHRNIFSKLQVTAFFRQTVANTQTQYCYSNFTKSLRRHL